jgi:hypothetical protein
MLLPVRPRKLKKFGTLYEKRNLSFFSALGVELRALHLLGRQSAT